MSAAIHLLRHGMTDCTVQERFCGRHDPPLNAAGVRMAQAFARRRGELPAIRIATSPSARARQTGAIIAETRRLPVEVHPGLAELDYGDWDDRPKAEIVGTAAYRRWREDPAHRAPPGGESGLRVVTRATAALEELGRSTSGDLLVVSHKATIRLLVCAWLGIDPAGFQSRVACPIGSLTSLVFTTEGPLLVRLGDRAHLEPALDPAGDAR
jgi:probable phosphoglycerate mutase